MPWQASTQATKWHMNYVSEDDFFIVYSFHAVVRRQAASEEDCTVDDCMIDEGCITEDSYNAGTYDSCFSELMQPCTLGCASTTSL